MELDNKGVGRMKKIAVIPTLLTLGNAVCGFAAIALASKIGRPDTTLRVESLYALSGWLILAAMVFDSLDGYVARLSRTASNFGLQLDSLCDAISFGLAPAFLLLQLGPGWDPIPRLHQTLAVVAAMYMMCTILRLARFNVETSPDPLANKRFRGLPSPAAAGCIASMAILRAELPDLTWWRLEPARVQALFELLTTMGAFTVALLMVSRISYPHLTKQLLRGRRPFRHLVQVLMAVLLIVLIREWALALIFWGYAIWGVGRYLVLRAMHHPAANSVSLVNVEDNDQRRTF